MGGTRRHFTHVKWRTVQLASRVRTSLVAIVACVSVVARSESARAADAEPSDPTLLVRPEPLVPSPLPEIAAVFPGVIVHGSGTFLQNRPQTTERLLLLEGAGLLTTFLSGFVLFQTGAARDVVGPTALFAVAGAGTFGVSFAANLYATWAPPRGFGEARRELPLLESRFGYLYVYDPQFDYRHFAATQLDGRLGPWHVGARTAHAPLQDNQRYELLAGYRLVGPTARARAAVDGSYLEPMLGYSEHRFDGDGFAVRVVEVSIEGRLDSERYLPDVRGAFFQAQAGVARQWFAYDLPGVDTTNATSLLLAHMGFGIYFGGRQGAASPGGEVEIYYDHRHDGFAGGLKVNGLGSGVAGHFGSRLAYRITDHLGMYAQTEIGSAWSLGLGLSIQVGTP